MNPMNETLVKRSAGNACVMFWASAGLLLVTYIALTLSEFSLGTSLQLSAKHLTFAVIWNLCPLVLYGGLALVARRHPTITRMFHSIAIWVTVFTVVLVASIAADLISIHAIKNESFDDLTSSIRSHLLLLNMFLIVPIYWFSSLGMSVATFCLVLAAWSGDRAAIRAHYAYQVRQPIPDADPMPIQDGSIAEPRSELPPNTPGKA